LPVRQYKILSIDPTDRAKGIYWYLLANKMKKNSSLNMTIHGWIIRLLILLGLAMGGVACVSSASASSQLSGVLDCDVAKVPITGVHWFQEPGGAWRVVGVITNNSSNAVSKVVTGVETYNKAGQFFDKGEDVSAYPDDLQPGAQAPFTAWIDREIPGLDHFKVEEDECVVADSAERASVQVRGGRMALDDAGVAQVTAELFNPASKAVLVNGLMAAVYDQAGALITADYVNVATRTLAPGESGPVRASLYLPPGGAQQIKSFKFFMDAVVNQPSLLPLDVTRDVKIISHYTDKDGQFHLLGQITNPGSKGVMTSLQATVYTDSTKSSVADAASINTWVPLQPGESLPFDLTGWGALNSTNGLWDQLAKQNAAITLRLEPFLTWTDTTTVAKLSLMDGNVSFTGQQALFTGRVQNNMPGRINAGLVTAVVIQKTSGEIVAAGSQHLDITDSAAPGQVLDYSITLQLPANLDPSTLIDTEIMAVGRQP
jgi:hypothetical protein